MEPREPDGNNGYGGFRGFGHGYDAGPVPGAGVRGPEGLQLCPWERRSQFGFLNALYLTTRELLTGPQRFFSRMPTRVGLTQPLLYALILGVTAAGLTWLWLQSGHSLLAVLPDNLRRLLRSPLWTFLTVVNLPVLVAVSVLIRAVFMHLLLLLLGGNQLGFEATFRVAAYGQAVGVLALVPFCGGLVALVWELAIDIIGLYAIHDTDPWRAAVAVLVPAAMGLSFLAVVVTLLMISAGLA